MSLSLAAAQVWQRPGNRGFLVSGLVQLVHGRDSDAFRRSLKSCTCLSDATATYWQVAWKHQIVILDSHVLALFVKRSGLGRPHVLFGKRLGTGVHEIPVP